MEHEGKIPRKEVVTSADKTPTSPVFRNEIPAGAVMSKMRKEYLELRLDDIIRSCPKEFLPTLTEHLGNIRLKYNANERELTMVADALVTSLNAYVNKEVKTPMTADQAIANVREFLAQQESGTSY